MGSNEVDTVKMAEKNGALKGITNIVRALVNSRKPPVTVRILSREYERMESQRIPFQEMGYKTVEDLLAATGEFSLNYVGDDVIVCAKKNSKSAHIGSLVQHQKAPKARSRCHKGKQMRHPNSMSNQYSAPRQSSFNRSISNYNGQKKMGHHVNANGLTQNDDHLTKNISRLNKYQNLENGTYSQNVSLNSKSINSEDAVRNHHIKSLSSGDIYAAQNGFVTEKIDSILKEDNNNNKINCTETMRPILGSNNNNSDAVYIHRKQAKIEQHKHNTDILRQIKLRESLEPTPKVSVQERLKRKNIKHDDRLDHVVSSEGKSEVKSDAEIKFDNEQGICAPERLEFDSNLDAKTSLAQYCAARGYLPPSYSLTIDKFSRKCYSKVDVNGKEYSTYPAEFPNEFLAEEASAQKAIEDLTLAENKPSLPQSRDTDDQLIEKMYKKLLCHPSGLFAKSIPEWFESEYSQSIPENWWTLVQTSNKFLTEKAANYDNIIVFPNQDAKDDIVSSPLLSDMKMPDIKLPWIERYWSFYITAIVSTKDMWARLIGTEYSDSYENLSVFIDNHMLENMIRPLSIALNEIYLVKELDSWYRVRVEDIDKENNLVLCFFIDIGEAVWYPVNNLYVCNTRFLSLPAQAVNFSLYGLEDFDGFPNSRKILADNLLNKSFIAEPLTKESEFGKEDENSLNKIRIVLYDTSTAEDINMNYLIQVEICKNASSPKLNTKGITKVIISNITDQCEIYLKIKNMENDYVNKLIQQLISTKFNKDQHVITHDELKKSDLFLVRDDSRCEDVASWHRGTLAEKIFEANDQLFPIYYVDEGTTHRTHISNLFRLESLSTALCKYPYQTIKVRLDNIPPIDQNILARIRALLPINTEALVKISKDADVPYVYIYKLIDENTTCTVNDAIWIDHELKNKDNGYISEVSPSPELSHSLTSASKTLSSKLNTISITSPVPNSPIKSIELPKLKNFTDLPKVGDYFDVRVVMSANPTNFKIQLFNECKRLDSLMLKLQEFCKNSNQEIIPFDLIEVGQAYAAHNPDGFYHRAIIDKIFPAEKMVCVYYADFGDMAIVQVEDLKILPTSFRDLPKMAIQAKLHDLVPIGGDWTKADCIRFRELTVGKKFVGHLVKVSIEHPKRLDPNSILEMDLVDVSTDEDIYIRQLFIDEKRGAPISS